MSKALEFYAKVEHLLGIEDATDKLHHLFLSELEEYSPKTLLDVGCGRGGFMKLMQEEGVKCVGIDKSEVMVSECQKQGLEAYKKTIDELDGSFDAIVSIFDVLNFFDENELKSFLDSVATKLNDGGVFIADINSLYGFRDVAEGSMVNESEDEFLVVNAAYEDEQLITTFTLFAKQNDNCYTKYQESLTQYFHKITAFIKHPKLKLKQKQPFSLYDTKDKVLLILQKV